ncbi:uncharacterized protein LOC107264589 isoform X2 [Cephus cinctus]|uniref:Uncharacterized protein LOC107264589 isoform X2 n=1 Tax=Cephus cinctus TaxID=211228 RepID=A0AAJ7FEY9_CEPCN|nr:uncharacterized protein LOC107264589 isoform X2 [Cephus cinctus]
MVKENLLRDRILGLVAYGFGISQGSTVMRAGSGIKIGTNERGTGSRGSRTGTVRGNSGVRIGEGRIHNSTRQRIIPSTPVPPPPQLFTHAPAAVHSDSQNITYLKVGMMVPYKSFGVREYTKAVTTALNNLQKSTRGPRLGLFQRYDIHVRIDMMELTPSPTGEIKFWMKTRHNYYIKKYLSILYPILIIIDAKQNFWQ